MGCYSAEGGGCGQREAATGLARCALALDQGQSSGRAQSPAQPVRVPWHHDQMHTVRHQAPGPDRHAGRRAMFRRKRPAGLVILVGERYRLAPVAALRHMMRQPRRHNPRDPRHDRETIPSAGKMYRNWYCVPGILDGVAWNAGTSLTDKTVADPDTSQPPSRHFRCAFPSFKVHRKVRRPSVSRAARRR